VSPNIYYLTQSILSINPLLPCISNFLNYLSENFPKYHASYCMEIVLFHFITKIHEDRPFIFSIQFLSQVSKIKQKHLLKFDYKFFEFCMQDNFQLLRMITFMRGL
jgi:hypothetical protein